MPPRRTHRKSRLGCLQCKQRKIKCDEAPPPCSNCRKHDVECRYPLPSTRQRESNGTTVACQTKKNGTSNNSHHDSGSLSLSSSTTSGNSPYLRAGSASLNQAQSPEPVDNLGIFNSLGYPATQQSPDLNIDDLELMHHYTTHTYKTLANTDGHKELWKTDVPKEAIAQPFLMHGILALAALHLAECNQDSEESRRKYIELATQHQNRALAAFRPQLNNITTTNCHAVFAFSILIAALAFAFSRTVGSPRAGEPVDAVLQDFFLFRGVEGVLSTHLDTIQRGRLGPLLCRPRNAAYFQPLSRDVIDTLDHLHDCNGKEAAHMSSEERDAYNHAIRELRISFERSPASLENVFRWPIVLPESYLLHLKSRKPMALVILAHYCVILRGLDSYWWSKGWSGNLFEAIYLALDESWKPLLQWPMQMVGMAHKLAKIQ